MIRELKLSNYNVFARACEIEIEKVKSTKGMSNDLNASLITSVDLKGTKSLRTMSGDFGLVCYNENNIGLMISWKQFENIQSELKITEEKYEDFLDDFTNNFTDTIIEHVKELNK